MISLIQTAFLIDMQTGENLSCACGIKERVRLELKAELMNAEYREDQSNWVPVRYKTFPFPNMNYTGFYGTLRIPLMLN